LLLFLLTTSIYLNAQGHKEYYIKEKTDDALSSQSKFLNTDGSLALCFYCTAYQNSLDLEGDLMYSGQNFEVTPDITKTYKLEVIAEKEGFKDYTDIVEEGVPFEIKSLSPNSATQNVLVNYHVASDSSSYIMITDLSNAQSNNYILDSNASELVIDLSNFQPSTYGITLVSDGNVIESKNLIKN
jgi:hypothetical protein